MYNKNGKKEKKRIYIYIYICIYIYLITEGVSITLNPALITERTRIQKIQA